MFHRNSDSMNKSNFDTISHPLLPPPALTKIRKKKKQLKTKPCLPANRVFWMTLKVFDIGFGGWYSMNGPDIFYEVDKVVNEWWGRQFGWIWGEVGQCKSDPIRMWSLPGYKRLLLKMPSWCLEMEILFHKWSQYFSSNSIGSFYTLNKHHQRLTATWCPSLSF